MEMERTGHSPAEKFKRGKFLQALLSLRRI
jgi:hypothetical protein